MQGKRLIAIVGLLAVFLAPVRAGVSAGGPPGDVNYDGHVNAIDAQLVLQFDAGTITGLPNPYGADVNYDERINSLDALLILQVDAGLIPNSDLTVGAQN